MKRLLTARTILAATAMLAPLSLHAQDTRTVTQPVIPPLCSAHGAEITVTSGDLNTTDNLHFDTGRIQAALNACPSGEAVALTTSGTYNAFQIQPITIPAGVTLVIYSGVTVFASINPRDYDTSSGACGIVSSGTTGCNPLITVASGSGSGIMGAGTINGRGGDTIQNTTPSTTWWALSNTAQTEGLNANNPNLVYANTTNNFTLYQTSFVNAPVGHIIFKYGTGYTVWGITINTPYSARNTDGLDIGNGENVTVTQSTISDGDDDIAIEGAGGQVAKNMTISNNHIFAGHGVSIGSPTEGGVANILVNTVSFSGNTSDSNSTAMRIKSAANEGGLVNNVTYENICIQNVKYPLQLNPHYNSDSGTEYPDFTNITFENVHVLTAGQVELEGYNATYPATVTLNNVVFDTLPSNDITPAPAYATITLGPGPVSSNLSTYLTGTDVTVHNDITNSNAAYSCTNAFGTVP
jgi:polygalacturonase